MEKGVGPVTIFGREVDVPRDPDDPDLPAWEVVRTRAVGDSTLADYRELMSEVVDLLGTIERRPSATTQSHSSWVRHIDKLYAQLAPR